MIVMKNLLYFALGLVFAIVLYSSQTIRLADVFIFGAFCALTGDILLITLGALSLLWIVVKWRKAPVGAVLFTLFLAYEALMYCKVV